MKSSVLNEFLSFWSDSKPQLNHTLRQWDHLYDRWRAEYCALRTQNFFRLVGKDISTVDSVCLCNYERYTCCVNIHCSSANVHICDFFPIVIGTSLDRKIRNVFWSSSQIFGDVLKTGMFVLNRNYFHFSACLNTNPRVCHVYRPSARCNDVEVRSYFYDQLFRGHKLYYRESINGLSRLTLRNCFTQEYDLFLRTCVVCKVAGNLCNCVVTREQLLREGVLMNENIVEHFVASCLPDVQSFFCAGNLSEFVVGTYMYMRETRILDHDIDLLRNKCVFNGPHLYSLFANQFARTLERFNPSDLLNTDCLAYVQRSRVLSHTANLYMFVSRKTNIRVDVTGGMKRSLKTEVRREKHDQQRDVVSARNASCVIVPGNSVAPVAVTCNLNYNDVRSSSVDEPVTQKMHKDVQSFKDFSGTYQVACPLYSFNVSQMLIYGKSPFLYNVSAFHFTDLEYVFEQVKRLRVENLNAVKCLLMPREFEGFLSHYNIGNISSAGRSMNLCVRTRTSFFCLDTRVVVRSYIDWVMGITSRLPRVSGESEINFIVNEMCITQLRIPEKWEKQFFVLSKLTWPGIQIFRRSSQVKTFAVIVNSGVTFVPYTLALNDENCNNVWYCDICQIYTAEAYSSCRIILQDVSMVQIFFPNAVIESDIVCCGGITSHMATRKCHRHLWISPSEKFYLTLLPDTRPQQNLFWHEIACHGLLRVACFVSSVDISKIIVSINAERRKIRFQHSTNEPALEMLMDQNVRVVVRDNLFPFVQDRANKRYPSSISSSNSFKCFFMFGDFKGRNCEDAYVFDSAFVPRSDTVCQFKINVYKHDRSVVRPGSIRFVDNAAVNVRCGGAGCVVRLGYIISVDRLRFGSSVICTYEQRSSAARYLYTLFYTNNASYLDESYADIKFNSFPEVTCDKFDFYEYSKTLAADFTENVVLYEATRSSDCRRVKISTTVTSRQLRFSISFRENRQIYKFQNRCGQKGMPVYSDLSHLRAADGSNVHMIVSAYSILGRTPVSQWLEQKSSGVQPVIDTRTRRTVGYGGRGEFFFSCDSPHDNFLMSSRIFGTNPVRFCNLTYHALTETGLSSSTFLTSNDHENGRNSPYSFISEDVQKILTAYRYYNRAFDFVRLRLAERRRVARSAVMLRSRGISCCLLNLQNRSCEDEVFSSHPNEFELSIVT